MVIFLIVYIDAHEMFWRCEMSDAETIILDTMKKEGKPMRPGDIAAKASVEKKEVSKIINKLKKEGKVMSPKRCFYAPVDT